MTKRWILRRFVLNVLFRIALPLAAKLPLSLGMWVASALGYLCYWLDLDWRTVALRSYFVKQKTRLAMAEMVPHLTKKEREALVVERFVNASREELEGHWFALNRAREFTCSFEGLDAVLQQLQSGKGLVLLTMHFDASLMGIVQLGLAGCKLNPVASNVVEDVRVPTCVQRYFKSKYAGIDSHINGGRTLHVENKLRFFYDALRRGEGVVILSDAPTGQVADAQNVAFLGKRRAIAPGAFRMADKVGCAMTAFVCLRTGAGRYKVIFSPVYDCVTGQGHSTHADLLFQFFSDHLLTHPGRWWAADQLPNFINFDDK